MFRTMTLGLAMALLGTVERIMKMKQCGRMFFLGNDLYIYNGGREYFNGFAGIQRIQNVLAR